MEMVRGRYGVFKVVVDGNTVVDGGAAAFLALFGSPSTATRSRIPKQAGIAPVSNRNGSNTRVRPIPG